MSESTQEPNASGIDDEQLPEDLRPSEDNPLAEGLPDGETAGDLLADGKTADESPDEPESEGADDGEPQGDGERRASRDGDDGAS